MSSNALTEMYSKFEGNIVYDQAHMDQVTAAINTLEKKKIKYKIIPMPLYGEDGLEVTFALIIVVDKKNVKKNKKMISNNKYILFNSWYTKNRKESWPNSHTMWNLMKRQPQAKPFVDIFDFMEKLGKTIDVKRSEAAVDENNNEIAVPGDADIKEGNERRIKLYNEFYRIATVAFETNCAPAASFIYDIKLSKSADGSGLERLTRSVLQHGVEAFKSALFNNKPAPSSPESLPADKTRKRKQLVQTKPKKLSKQRRAADDAPTYRMVDDFVEDSQMSIA
ncbi:9K [Peridroma alphabaculovirus]|uniref:9K n=1 Tax=Peridroma alphabaculovirus TaxID=1346829 RepID=A0A068LKM9_9ABAC|nr:9K [Peridroma alphabaculovirus]AIE47847.1 9K [Peridroma alphabaculovirus]